MCRFEHADLPTYTVMSEKDSARNNLATHNNARGPTCTRGNVRTILLVMALQCLLEREEVE